MIKMTLLTGKYAGETRDVSGVNPIELLRSLWLGSDTEWSIDYSEATPEEVIEWGKHDMSIRCIRALKRGRKVFFMNQVFEGFSEELVGELEDEIVECGFMVKLVSDDENGVVIGTGDFE